MGTTERASSRQEFVDERFEALANLVTNGPNMVEVMARGVVENPVFVAFAGVVRTGVAATHRDHDIGSFDGLGGEDFGPFRGNVNPFFRHGLDGDRIDLVCRLRAGRADIDPTTG